MFRSKYVPPAVVALFALLAAGCDDPQDVSLDNATATATTVAQLSVPLTPSFVSPVPLGTITSEISMTRTPSATTTTGLKSTEQASAPVKEVSAKNEVELAEAKVFNLTNAERAANGCPALRVDERLDKAARGHSADMAGNSYFSHASQDGRNFADRIKAAGHPSPGAENIAAGQRTPEDVVQGWMKSPGHRANILNCELKTLGVGMARGGSYGIYWTQNFGR